MKTIKLKFKQNDNIKILVDYGRWKKGHTGYVYNIGMECGDAQYDYAVMLDGDAFCSGFNENELEEDNI